MKVIQLKKISLKYSLLNKDNLKHPIQMELSLKRKTFLKFLKARLNFQNLQKIKKKMTVIVDLFPKLWTPKSVLG